MHYAVAMGFVANLARPRGNITGVTGFASELGGKWLELLQKVAPSANRVAVLTNPSNPNSPFIVRMIEHAAQPLGIQLYIAEVRNSQELDSAFEAMTSAGVAALIVPPDPMLHGSRQRVVELAAASQLPAIYGGEKAYMDVGGLMFYGTSLL
jgi:putative ABC transport system substrate-binding protein